LIRGWCFAWIGLWNAGTELRTSSMYSSPGVELETPREVACHELKALQARRSLWQPWHVDEEAMSSRTQVRSSSELDVSQPPRANANARAQSGHMSSDSTPQLECAGLRDFTKAEKQGGSVQGAVYEQGARGMEGVGPRGGNTASRYRHAGRTQSRCGRGFRYVGPIRMHKALQSPPESASGSCACKVSGTQA
jgi:hypothetical protein